MATNYNNNGKLMTVAGTSLPSNHIININLMQQVENLTSPGPYLDTKPKFFFLYSLAPGVGNQQNRSYNFQDAISLKFSLQEMSGLVEVMREVAKANIYVLPFIKFSKSNGESKSVSIMHSTKENKFAPSGKEPVITIMTVKGSQKNGLSVSPAQALGFCKMVDNLVNRGMNLEIDRQINAPRQQDQQYQRKETVVLNTANNMQSPESNTQFNNNQQPVNNNTNGNYRN